MSASSYSDLAEHAGHEIEVVVYGGNQNAAVQCETCATVLLDFDRLPDGNCPAHLAALVAVAERHRLQGAELAGAVTHAGAGAAETANQAGVRGQLAYLLAAHGPEAALQMVEDIAARRLR